MHLNNIIIMKVPNHNIPLWTSIQILSLTSIDYYKICFNTIIHFSTIRCPNEIIFSLTSSTKRNSKYSEVTTVSVHLSFNESTVRFNDQHYFWKEKRSKPIAWYLILLKINQIICLSFAICFVMWFMNRFYRIHHNRWA